MNLDVNSRAATASLRRNCAVLAVIAGASCALPAAHADNVSPRSGSIAGSVTVLDKNDREMKDRSNVVVFLDGVTLSQQQTTTITPPKISHKGRAFSPRVLPIVRNGTVDFFNDDDIYHNVFSLSKSKTFDLGIYPKGTSKLVTFDKPGLVKIYCNIHPNMISNILVLNNGFFAQTGVDGAYEIPNVPDGDFILRAWSAYSDEVHREISITDGAPVSIAFEIRQTNRIRPHKNKFGRPYREKY